MIFFLLKLNRGNKAWLIVTLIFSLIKGVYSLKTDIYAHNKLLTVRYLGALHLYFSAPYNALQVVFVLFSRGLIKAKNCIGNFTVILSTSILCILICRCSASLGGVENHFILKEILVLGDQSSNTRSIFDHYDFEIKIHFMNTRHLHIRPVHLLFFMQR